MCSSSVRRQHGARSVSCVALNGCLACLLVPKLLFGNALVRNSVSPGAWPREAPGAKQSCKEPAKSFPRALSPSLVAGREASAPDGRAGAVLRSTGVGLLLRSCQAQLRAHLVRQVPRQERFDVLGRLTTRPRAALQIPVQPQPGIDLPQLQRGEE